MTREEKGIKSSGVDVLDVLLGGGIPSGSLVCGLINPKSMAGVLVYQNASIGNVLYFTTDRKPEHVLKEAKQLGFGTENISFVDIYSIYEGKNAAARKNIYELSYNTAKNNAKIITAKVKPPEDAVWDFECWRKGEKGSETIGDLCYRVFAEVQRTMVEQDKFAVTEIDRQNKRFAIEFNDCSECSELDGFKEGVCYQHAGFCAGLISSLLDMEMDAYEEQCHAAGNANCKFIIAPSSEKGVQENVNRFLNPPSKQRDVELCLWTEHALKKIHDGEDNRIIVDNFSFYIDVVNNKERIRHVLNRIYELVSETKSICFLYVFKDSHSRDIENMVANKCDAVFDLDVIYEGEKVTNMLTISKMRGMSIPVKRIRVIIKKRITFDPSQEIV